MIKEKFKRGVAMIELIFAIVIISIVLLSTPTLIRQSINSSNVVLQQESIAAAATHTAIILSKHWDEANANISAGVAPIININRLPFELEGLDGVYGRVSRISNVEVNASAIGLDANETSASSYDDIDDADGQTFELILFNNEITSNSGLATDIGIGDYLDKNISITTAVRYAEDRPTTGTIFTSDIIDTGNNLYATTLPSGTQSNIKLITVRLTSNSGVAELDKNITIHAFSCNLGTYIPEGRQY